VDWTSSISVESVGPESFRSFCRDVRARFGADLFLSGTGDREFVGVGEAAMLAVTEGCGTGDLADFAFAGPGPCAGFLSYEFGAALRGAPGSKSIDFPPGLLRKYRAGLEYDPDSGLLAIGSEEPALADELAALASRVGSEPPPPPPPFRFSRTGPLLRSLSREQYIERVRETLDRIRDGWTYQLNLSIAYEHTIPDLDGNGLFWRLLEKHPARFFALVSRLGGWVLSTSPERFLQVKAGEVLSQPIKGTVVLRPGDDPGERGRELRSSPKESAELAMIVDLVRNDISGDCGLGTVRVEREQTVFRVDDLLQMQTDVRGRLRDDRNCLDLLLAASPGGSVTGCPKRSSLEIIDELEPHPRGIFCGSFFVIRGPRDMESAIAIRTADYDEPSGVFRFHAGSGIVVDSDPEKEFIETEAKAAKFLGIIDQQGRAAE